MAKRNKRRSGVMGRSDIPYAQRIRMQQHENIRWSREQAARVTMYCWSVAMHEIEGVGYERLVRYASRFAEVDREFYGQELELSMDQARRRLAGMGIEISGEIMLAPPDEGHTRRQMQVKHNVVQAVQGATICACITANDVFGWAKVRLEQVRDRVEELTARYAREGEGFLLEELEKLGFVIVDGHAVGFVDGDGKAVRTKEAMGNGT